MNCKKCNGEIDKKAVVCVHCGCKIKKPIYKKWWFWVLIAVIAIIGGASGGNNTETVSIPKEETVVDNSIQENVKYNTSEEKEEIVYEVVDLQTMFDDLSENAMKAESQYQKKYVEFQCKISNFDSDGKYISVKALNASEWDFTNAMCYIKNDTQKEFLIQKNVGDSITVKGQVKSIGEVLGYSIDIKEVY